MSVYEPFEEEKTRGGSGRRMMRTATPVTASTLDSILHIMEIDIE
jgi:hypothetical protein